jgi:hypothetical protein
MMTRQVLSVFKEGKPEDGKTYQVEYYNLGAIISNRRAKPQQATRLM